MDIWHTLKKPYTILAPMEDVTDTVFRQIIASCVRPDVFFTEFTNVEGLSSKGDQIVSQRLKFTQEEKPIIAQVWGKTPEHFYLAAKRIAAMGFDGIDINMGCPEKSVVKQGCCIALIHNRPLTSEIIAATKKGAGYIPVSIKTRIGLDKIITEEWVSFLLSHNIDALTIHGRTAAEKSEAPCHWDEIAKAVIIRNQMKKQTHIIGNGDVLTLADAKKRVAQSGVDGVMIGRGIFKNPYLFSGRLVNEISIQERFDLLEKHIMLWHGTWDTEKNFPTLKKYFKIYVSEFPGSSNIRAQFMEAKNIQEASQLLLAWQKKLQKKSLHSV